MYLWIISVGCTIRVEMLQFFIVTLDYTPNRIQFIGPKNVQGYSEKLSLEWLRTINNSDVN